MILDALMLGLGVMKIVDFIESLIPWRQREWLKMLYAWGLSFLGTAFLRPLTTRQAVLIPLGSIGIAAIGHAIEAFLLTRRDVAKTEVVKAMRGVRH